MVPIPGLAAEDDVQVIAQTRRFSLCGAFEVGDEQAARVVSSKPYRFTSRNARNRW